VDGKFDGYKFEGTEYKRNRAGLNGCGGWRGRACQAALRTISTGSLRVRHGLYLRFRRRIHRWLPEVMRLMLALVVMLMVAGRSGGRQRSRVMRDHTHRSRKGQRTLHRQEAAKQKNDQMSDATVHDLKLTRLSMMH